MLQVLLEILLSDFGEYLKKLVLIPGPPLAIHCSARSGIPQKLRAMQRVLHPLLQYVVRNQGRRFRKSLVTHRTTPFEQQKVGGGLSLLCGLPAEARRNLIPLRGAGKMRAPHQTLAILTSREVFTRGIFAENLVWRTTTPSPKRGARELTPPAGGAIDTDATSRRIGTAVPTDICSRIMAPRLPEILGRRSETENFTFLD